MSLKLCTLAYLRDGDKTLMLSRGGDPGHLHAGRYNGLGGKFEAGESPEECLSREVYEESGLTVEQAELKGFLSFPSFDGTDDWYTFVYLVTRFSGQPRPSAEGDLHWIPTAQLGSLPLWPGDHLFLPWLDQPGFFSGTFRYQDQQLIGHEVTFYRP